MTTANTSSMGGFFFAESISLTPNGPGNWVWSCIGCTGWETIKVHFKGGSFTGTALPGPTYAGEQSLPYDGTCTNCTSATDYTLSGTVEAVVCSCGATRPLPGVTVTASGPNGSSTVTGPKGDYSIMLPGGTYTVTPSLDEDSFSPPSRTVNLNAGNPNANANFTTCAGTGSEAGTAGTGVAAPVADAPGELRMAEDTSQTGCPNGIDWQMEPRTDEVPKRAGQDPLGMLPNDYIYAPLGVYLYLTAQGKRVTQCPSGSVWKWQVTAKPAGAQVVNEPEPGCDSYMDVSQGGDYKIEANRYTPEGALRQTVKGTIKVHDLLMVGLGDSNGSGEGLPLPPFWNNQCDRGSNSYQYQAAQLLEKQSKLHTSVTFVSAACSGAAVKDLTEDSYRGVNPGNYLPAQITEVTDRLKAPDGAHPRKVDAVVISVGINDAGFGAILGYCAEWGLFTHTKVGKSYQDTPCQDTKVSAKVNAETNETTSFSHDHKSAFTLAQQVKALLGRLLGLYGQLDAALKASSLAGAKVYITQYPNFSYAGGAQHFCGSGSAGSFFAGGTSTWAWLSAQGTTLNNMISTAAANYGWVAVPVPANLFYNHGYCASDSWFVGLDQVGTHSNEAFHPTLEGARITAVLLFKAMCPLLADPKACTGAPSFVTDESGPPGTGGQAGDGDVYRRPGTEVAPQDHPEQR